LLVNWIPFFSGDKTSLKINFTTDIANNNSVITNVAKSIGYQLSTDSPSASHKISLSIADSNQIQATQDYDISINAQNDALIFPSVSLPSYWENEVSENFKPLFSSNFNISDADSNYGAGNYINIGTIGGYWDVTAVWILSIQNQGSITYDSSNKSILFNGDKIAYVDNNATGYYGSMKIVFSKDNLSVDAINSIWKSVFVKWDTDVKSSYGVVKVDVTESSGADFTNVSNNYRLYVYNENDAPKLESSKNMTSINEDSDSNVIVGNYVRDIFTMSDPDVGGGLVSNSYLTKGIAITSLGEMGTWQYKLNGSTVWTTVMSTDVSEKHALLLLKDDMIRFKPNANFDGDSSFTFYAWDRSSGANGSYADLSGANSRGGFTAFSVNSMTSSIDIISKNDAPMNVTTNSFNPINEDSQTSLGTSVKNLINFSDADFSSGVVPEANKGIAISGVGSNGFFEYSLNNRASWIKVDAVSSSHALLLSGDSLIRFRPDENFNGSSSIKFYAWDKSVYANGDFVDLSSSSSRGGITPFGVEEKSSSIVVNAVDDAPSITGLPDVLHVNDVDVRSPMLLFSDTSQLHIEDVDDVNFTSGILRVGITTSNEVQHFSIANHNGILFNESTHEVSLNNAKIGTVELNPSNLVGNGLEVSLTAEATPEALKALLGAITYQNTDAVAFLDGINVSLLDHQGGEWYSKGFDFYLDKTINYPTVINLTNNEIQAGPSWSEIKLNYDSNGQNIAVTDKDDSIFYSAKIELVGADGNFSIQLNSSLLTDIASGYDSYSNNYEPSSMPGSIITGFGWHDDVSAFNISGSMSLSGINTLLNAAYISHNDPTGDGNSQVPQDFKVKITTTSASGDVASADILIDFPPDHII